MYTTHTFTHAHVYMYTFTRACKHTDLGIHELGRRYVSRLGNRECVVKVAHSKRTDRKDAVISSYAWNVYIYVCMCVFVCVCVCVCKNEYCC